MSEHPFKDAAILVKPFKIDHSDQSLDDLKTLLRLSPVAPDLYENDAARDRTLGIDRDWMSGYQQAWLEYDWRVDEADLNKLPHFLASVPCPQYGGEGYAQDVHFIGIMNRDLKQSRSSCCMAGQGAFSSL